MSPLNLCMRKGDLGTSFLPTLGKHGLLFLGQSPAGLPWLGTPGRSWQNSRLGVPPSSSTLAVWPHKTSLISSEMMMMMLPPGGSWVDRHLISKAQGRPGHKHSGCSGHLE